MEDVTLLEIRPALLQGFRFSGSGLYSGLASNASVFANGGLSAGFLRAETPLLVLRGSILSRWARFAFLQV